MKSVKLDSVITYKNKNKQVYCEAAKHYQSDQSHCKLSLSVN